MTQGTCIKQKEENVSDFTKIHLDGKKKNLSMGTN